MEDNVIRVDADGLADQVEEDSEKNGFTIKIFIPQIFEDGAPSNQILPLIKFKGYANPLMLAIAYRTMQDASKQLLEYDDVKEAVEIFDRNITGTRTIKLTEKGNEND